MKITLDIPTDDPRNALKFAHRVLKHRLKQRHFVDFEVTDDEGTRVRYEAES